MWRRFSDCDDGYSEQSFPKSALFTSRRSRSTRRRAHSPAVQGAFSGERDRAGREHSDKMATHKRNAAVATPIRTFDVCSILRCGETDPISA
jgi:hypothetical protein